MKAVWGIGFFLVMVIFYGQQKFTFTPPDNFTVEPSSHDEVVYKNPQAGAIIQIKEVVGLAAEKAILGFSSLQFSKNNANLIEEINLNMQQPGLIGKLFVSQFFIQEADAHEMYRMLAIIGSTSTTYYISITIPPLSYKVLKDPLIESLQAFNVK